MSAESATATPDLVAVIVLCGLLAVLVIVIVTTIPWRLPFWGSGQGIAVDSARDFTAQERVDLASFQGRVVPPMMARVVVGALASVSVAVTPVGARLMGAASEATAGMWWAATLIGTLVLLAVTRLVTLPFELRSAQVSRAEGVLTQSWAGWFADRARAFMLGALVTCGSLLAVVGSMMLWPNWWWVPMAAAGAGGVIVAALLVPIVVEPMFLRFTPLPPGPMRDRMMDLAARDDVHVRDVLVADASRRTTALNAYVSGIGPTRRIVLYDGLTVGPEVDSVVAHELGHAKERDVLHVVLIAALTVAAGVVTAGLVVGVLLPEAPLVTSREVNPQLVPMLLAAATVLALASGPLQATMSRRIEARADLHALDLAGDAEAFIAMMRTLALSNRSCVDPSRWRYLLLFTHPTAPQRIAVARNWARARGLPEPPSCITES